MRLVMFGVNGQPDSSRPGILVDGGVLDIKMILDQGGHPFPVRGSLRDLIETGEGTLDLLNDLQDDPVAPYFISEDSIKLHAPLQDARKMILLAGNYIEHIRETGFRVPPSGKRITPQFFLKPPSTAVIGFGDPIRLPENSIWVDWEVELAVVISKKGKDIKEDNALDYVFGYTIVNDVSEREFNSQLEDRFEREKDPFFDWLHGKWFDGFAPMGPCILTKDCVADPHQLRMILYHNGKLEQDGTTADMLHPISYLIHKLSKILTLEPGDIVSTGTPSGVGYSKGIKLARGDELLCEIEPIGSLWNPVV